MFKEINEFKIILHNKRELENLFMNRGKVTDIVSLLKIICNNCKQP
jgi:hypothetical protein